MFQSSTQSSTRKAAKPLSGFEQRWLKLQFSRSMRMRIYEKLSKFIANGVPITQALEELQLHASHDGKKPRAVAAQVLHEWRQSMLNGLSFARALKGWVSGAELSLVQAGETAGQLDQALQDLLYFQAAQQRIRGALMGLMYPIVLVAVTCLYLYIFGAQVVPAFAQVLPVDQWQGAGKSLALLSGFVEHGLLPLVVLLVLLLALIGATLGLWTGRVRQVLDRIPPWSIYRLVMGSSFLISFSALLTAGISVPDALRMIAEHASPWLRQRLLATRQEVLNGAGNIGEALHRTGYNFPSWESVIDIRAYAALDGFEGMIDKLSRQWMDETVQAIGAQMDVLRNVSIVVMGFLFMWIASGMFALQQQISSSVH